MREGNTEYYIEATVQISFLKLTNTSKRLYMLKKHTGFFFPWPGTAKTHYCMTLPKILKRIMRMNSA